MAKKCDNKACGCLVLDGVSYCSRHKNGPGNKSPGGNHKHDNGSSRIFDSAGKVGIGMGLSRLAREDRDNWEAKNKNQQTQ